MDFQNSIAQITSSKRILVLGSGGSGKTTFSIKLGRILDLEPIHLDAHFWKPGWIATNQSEWRETVSSLIREPSWIMDGTYESTLDMRIPAADAIVLIDSSRWTCLWRVLKRKATLDDHRRPDAPSGQKLDRAFLGYIWRYPSVTRTIVADRIRSYGPDKNVIQIGGTRNIQQFLWLTQQTVEQASEAN